MVKIIGKIYGKIHSLWDKLMPEVIKAMVSDHRESKRFAQAHYHKGAKPGKSSRRPVVVFVADGKYHQGGLCDRLKGLTSVFHFCRANGLEFRIAHVYPFALSKYLEPNEYDWTMAEPPAYDLGHAAPYLIFDKINTPTRLLPLKHARTRFANVYTNIKVFSEHFPQDFNTLFKPSALLADEIERHLRLIGGRHVSVSFRFVSLLGDFTDQPHFPVLDEAERLPFMEKCREAVMKIHGMHPGHKVFVATDSIKFLAYIKDLDFVYVVDGEIAHIDWMDVTDDSNLKTFVDLFLISKADSVYLAVNDHLYRSGFPITAALISGRSIKEIRFSFR